jgi:hypothetical protein
MTAPTSSSDQLRKDFDSLQFDIDNLRKKVALTDVSEQISSLHSNTLGLPLRIQDLRARHYAFEKNLENKAADLGVRWGTIKGTAEAQLMQHSALLQNDMRSLDAKMPQLSVILNNIPVAQPLLNAIQVELDNLDSRASAAATTVQSVFSAFEQEFTALNDHLNKVTWSLEQLGESTFQLLATEGLLMAVKATWAKDGKEDSSDPQGVLYITDQRLIFEQKQEVATKKVLFITTASEKVQKTLWDFPAALVQEVTATKQGVFKNQDFLELHLASGAPFSELLLHIDGQDSNAWAVMIKSAKSHEFDDDRAIPLDQAAVEKVKAAPTTCPNCSAAITKPVLRGQDTITCDFCGAVIKL